MYLRKTTTAKMRGLDILHPVYERLNTHFKNQKELNILQIGAGICTKTLGVVTNQNKLVRRLDSFFRTLPLPHNCYENHETHEIYQAMGHAGFIPKLTVLDINPQVLQITRQQNNDKQISYTLLDISEIPSSFLTPQYDLIIMMNVLYHIKENRSKTQAIGNVVKLCNPGALIIGLFESDYVDYIRNRTEKNLSKIGELTYKKIS